MSDYFKHRNIIERGEAGQLTKIKEEYDKLVDAHDQKKAIFALIEASDLVLAVGRFVNKQYKFPLLLIILLAYLSIPYKIIRKAFNNSFNKFLRKRKELTKKPYKVYKRTNIWN